MAIERVAFLSKVDWENTAKKWWPGCRLSGLSTSIKTFVRLGKGPIVGEWNPRLESGWIVKPLRAG